MKTAC